MVVSASVAIKYSALQQVQIFAHFIHASNNDLLVSEPPDQTISVYLGFIAILIAPTSSWNFPHPYRDSPFYFRITNKLSMQPS